jgi:hypothetical protein
MARCLISRTILINFISLLRRDSAYVIIVFCYAGGVSKHGRLYLLHVDSPRVVILRGNASLYITVLPGLGEGAGA